MTDLQAVRQRISRRDFLDKPISSQQVLQINKLIENNNQLSGLELKAVFNDEETHLFPYGRFKNPKNYILMLCDESLENYNFKIGYYGQNIMLNLVKMGFGACWAGISFSRSNFNIPKGKRLRAVMIFGYVNEEISDFEKFVTSSTVNVNHDLDYFYSSSESVPEKFIDGIKAVSLAPSAMNRQPVHFIYKDNMTFSYVEKPNSLQGIDLGIAVKHFEIGSNGEIPVKITEKQKLSPLFNNLLIFK